MKYRIKFFRRKMTRAGRLCGTTPNGKRFCVRHLPVRQTLIWAGPVFILVQPR